MEDSQKDGTRAVNIVNGLHEKGIISFEENGQVNIIGNAHEQPEEEEKEWVRLTQFEW